MSARQKCPVEGCPGFIDVTTNGSGRTIDTPCPYCTRRAEWERRNMPSQSTRACRICGGPVPPVDGKRGRKLYCVPCGKVSRAVKAAKSRVTYAQKQAAKPALRIEQRRPA